MHPRLLLIALALAVPARADIVLLGQAALPGDAVDRSGLKGKLADGTPHDRLGGLGSGIAYTGFGQLYVLVSDRGPHDGAVPYDCRVHWMEIAVRPGHSPAVGLKLTATTLLTDEKGRRFVGAASALDPRAPERSGRLDPEGVRVGPAGTLFVSDEYGPHVLEFSRTGRKLRSFPVPARYRPAHPAAKAPDELPPRNTVGRIPNRGFEGLAVSPDGARLYALLQSPLIQDTAAGKDDRRVGVNSRLLEIDVKSRRTREFVYPLADPGHGLNEILAVGGDEFLVLERDSKVGIEAKFKRVYRIHLAGATDVSDRDALPADALPEGVKPVAKQLFLDLLDPKHGIAGPDCPEKVEGLCFGPDLPDGRRLLLVTVDNDFVPEVPTRVYAFAIDAADLPGFQPQKFAVGK